MMFRLALICMALACASAYEFEAEHCCTMEDRHELLALWEDVWSAQYTGRRIAIARSSFARLFELEPDSKALFQNVNVENMESPEFTAHAVRVAGGFDTIMNLAFDPDSLNEELDHLAEQHAKFEGMKAEYFTAFRRGFAEVLPQAVPCFNVAAWNRCITEMQDHMAKSLNI